jgi:acetyltransferase-like isoleucine patch superfamily enzyme
VQPSMVIHVLASQRKALEEAGVTFVAENSEVHFGVGRHARVEMETPCELRPGRYDVGRIGAFSYLGGGATIVRNVSSIGRYCAIAPNLQAGTTEHRPSVLSSHPLFEGNWARKWKAVDDYYQRNGELIDAAKKEHDRDCGSGRGKIVIGNNVWVGEGVFIRAGVRIGDGAIIAARSVVSADVPDFAVVGGVPAKVIKMRHDEPTLEMVRGLNWWDYDLSVLDGLNLSDVASSARELRSRLKSAEPYAPPVMVVHPDHSVHPL